VPESSGSGKGSGEGEDLFEDLDKFFAPIQDVEWPDTTESAPSTPARAEEPRDEAPSHEPEDTTAFEPVPEAEPSAADATQPTPSSEPEVPEPIPGQEDLFGADEGAEAPTTWSAEPQPAGSERSGVGFLFGEEPDMSDDEAITEEAFAQSPTAYVDLPRPGDDEEPAVAELLEDETPAEEQPDLDTVEAAADHFAESVRDEVHVESEPVEPITTEEVAISALLGDEEADEPELEEAGARTVRVGPDGLGGPSWQEPTALEVGADTERKSTGRDVPMAFVTGLVLAAIGLGALAIGPGAFAIYASVAVLFAQGEFYFALQKRHYQPATALGLVSGALVLGAAYYRGEQAMLAMVALGVFASFLWYMTVPVQHRRNVVTNVALTALGIVYIPMLAGYALAVLRYANGRGLAVAIIGLTIAYDIAAFGVGYFWGSRPLAPNVSPKKSWEGAIGATLVVIALSVGAVASSVDLLDTVGRAVGLAVVVAIFAPLGDLAESLLKRDLGLKDIGSVLPGHGGVLDRIDALLFVAPAAFLYLRLIVF
jgi:phosphatidate cytidylyltransferase